MNNDEKLLHMLRHVESLSENERADIERLTGKERVMYEADRRVAAIVSRRKRVLAITALVAVAATAVVFVRPSGVEAPFDGNQVVAEVHAVATVEPEVEAIVTEVEEPLRHEYVAAKRLPTKQMRAEVAEKAEDRVVPEVKCNSLCDADSVINEIWHFLSV